MGKLLRIAGALHLSAIGLVSAIGRAEPPDEDGRARLELAADQAMRDGRFADARDALLAVWEATAEREVACNVGRLSFRIGDPVRAVEFLELCVSAASRPDKHTEGASLELAQARRQVLTVRVRGPEGTEVTVDGRPRGRTPLVAYLAPGPHTVRGTRPGGLEAERAVEGPAGASRVVDLELAAPAPRADVRILGAGAAASMALIGLGAGLALGAHVEEQSGAEGGGARNGCFRLEDERCQDVAASFEAANALRVWSAVALAAGASAAAGTLTYALLPRRRVTLSAVGTGVVVRGTW